MKSKNFDRLDILAAVCVLASFLAVANLPFTAKRFGDVDIYTDAKTFAGAIRGDAPWSSVGLNRLPFTTLYYAVPYVLVPAGSPDDRYWKASVAWTLPWIAVSLLLIRRVARYMCGEMAGRTAIGLMLLSPFVVYYALGITADAPAWVTTTVFLSGWSQWEQRPSARAFGLAVLGLAAMVLCRPNSLLVLACGIGCGLLLLRKRRAQALFALGCGIVVLAITLAVGVAESRLRDPAKARPALENLAHVAFHGSFQFRDEPWDWRFWDDDTRRGSVDYAHWVEQRTALKQAAERTGQLVSRLQLQWIARDYAEHPRLRLRIALIRILAFHVSLVNSVQPKEFHIGPLRGRVAWVFFHVLVNMSTFVLIAGALWFLISRRREFLSLWVLWAPWIALLIFHALTYVEPRYLMPARPALAIMAGCAFAPLVQRVAKHKFRRERHTETPAATAAARRAPLADPG